MDALRYGREIRWLFQAALLIFVVGVALFTARLWSPAEQPVAREVAPTT